MNLAQTERNALAISLLAKGPEAPTLCGDWTTKDLAAHLFVREHKPGSTVLSLLPGKQDPAEAEFSKALARPYDELVKEWQAGPKGLNPWRAFDSIANGMEHFIHHEDVLRGALKPGDDIIERPLPAAHQKELLRIIKLLAPRLVKSPRPIILQPVGLPRVVLHDKRGVADEGGDVCRIRGGVGEIVLWVSGRDVVDLSFEGNSEGVVRGSF
ncbi:hypothetical protein CDES_08815 [Corynebacterium deserti GIMN1.010]|uniref:Mycothiol-dependent maleylpyruvate isomerase metal-binding domain-containing protein n=1 Tax=Corynebacterium deserti GIMN1.010 TaxID=931089 RepID=A0A0M4CQG8_9CORY|nr:TIGR03085 family metal-binding protein [Corynebacterium deserti]ALC06155.1 hypothetical protein CDES_08815 [Corynebacterium deserti GIMN1.010]